ncbi:unnamed protein product [Paramecium primaurelia]|uniref:T-complex protein 1 subunit alpha n=1 Tax=Paramecium primaurelia TaxID=5886 RepID=A0A8S1MBG5_PARPR|nr:unnamed protein product [Paramecium primaurelia]
MSAVGIRGERDQGQDVRTSNVTAVMAIANVVKTSLGPQGLDKMLVDEIGDVVITNDGATILKQLEVEHPAAKVIVELSQLQDKEVGDGTTSVVVLAAELLRRANELIKIKVHPTTIISGYKQAARQAVKYIQSHLVHKITEDDTEILINAAKTSMNSKLIGPESHIFAKLAVDAVRLIKTQGLVSGKAKYPIQSINVVKSHGQSSNQSELVKGYVIQLQRASQQMVTKVKNAKIACLDINLNKFKMQMGVQILVDDPNNLEKIRKKEMDVLKERIQLLLQAGANVILTSKGMDDLANKYLVEAGAIGLRRVPKDHLRRIAKASGAKVVTTFANEETGESFDSTCLGEAEEVYEEAIGDNDYIFFKGMKKEQSASIIVRGANEMMTDEIERSLHDSLCVVKRTLESGSVVAGGGAVEMALSIYLDDYSRKLDSNEQIAIAEFSEALTQIPKILATNAAKDSIDLISKLRVLHSKSQQLEVDEKGYKFSGLDLIKGEVRHNLRHGVLEPTVSKIKALKFATEAAITILRIDDMIKLEPKKEQMPGRH